MDFRRFFIDLLIENHRFERESIESETLQSGTFNFWKMEGAQKATFSVLNLSSQMHFRSQLSPGGLVKGFQIPLKCQSCLHNFFIDIHLVSLTFIDFHVWFNAKSQI